MTKVYPNANGAAAVPGPSPSPQIVLTVWKKSLLPNCEGFTVFDAHGNLVYRVDNYGSSAAAEVFLMDAAGNTLLTIRRRRKSLMSRPRSWLVFDGEAADNNNHPSYTVVKKSSSGSTKWGKGHVLGYVTSTDRDHDIDHHRVLPDYEIEGCYAQLCCAVYDSNRRRVVEIKPKEAVVKGVAFGTDVFRLLVHPEFDTALAMAIVILLDRM